MDKQFKKILIIKMRFHGDMLLTTPVISTLKKSYPTAKIDILLYQETIQILSENREIHAFYGIENKKNNSIVKLVNFILLIKKLRKNNYDLIINLADQWIVPFLVRCIPAKIKISHQFNHRDTNYWSRSFTHMVKPTGTHVVEQNLSILKPLHLNALYSSTTMTYQPTDWKKINHRLISLGVHSSYVVIQPTARQKFKCWDDEKFAKVIDNLQSRGYRVILTSGPSKEDLTCVARIAQQCRQSPVTEFAGKIIFPELGALISHAALFIGVDSAPIHIAAALETPIICLFGATDHQYWKPWSKNVIQIWAGNYEKMPKWHERDSNKKYLSIIPVKDVITAIKKMLPMDI
ncbi:MAG: lipopolysaccharide core heptosyltransferase RfaQ [Arsenophonus sp.]